MKYDRSTQERWYLYGKSAGLGTGGTNVEVGSGWRMVPSAEVVKGGESVKWPRLCVGALWHGVTWCNLKSYCYVAGGCLLSLSLRNSGFHDLLRDRISSLLILSGCISISIASLMMRSM